MSRTIVSPNDLLLPPGEFHAGGRAPTVAARAAPVRPDAYADKLLKMIPAEIVAVWVTVRGILSAAATSPVWLQWLTFGILTALTPVYLDRVAHVSKPKQVWLTTGAFVVWAISLGDIPFGTLGAPYYLPIYGAVLLPLYTFAVPLVRVDRN